MRKYKQLTLEKRYQISILNETGMNKTNIANQLGVHKSTVSREIARNTGKRGYRPKQAHNFALSRRHSSHKHIKMTSDKLKHIMLKLKENWSPEQISGTMGQFGFSKISHERIYQHIWNDKSIGGFLYKFLRHSVKKHKKRYGANSRRGQIKNRVSIDERPDIVNKKSRIGDWEVDTMIGRNHKGALITLVERASKYTLIKKVSCKKARDVTKGVISMLSRLKDKVYTITGDNGKEFAYHSEISEALETSFYFANPYCSWERGLNENTNGLIRQYFPKKSSFDSITDEDLSIVMDRLNTRPRKSLGYATPKDIFLENHAVALMT